MGRQELEMIALKETIEEKDFSFPNDKLGVADKFLLKLVIHDAFDYFSKLEEKVPFRSYRFIYCVNECMKDWGYNGKELPIIP